jgi:ABC-2 type transport system permease protein
MTGRLSTLAAALVVARRDFTAILFSRSFVFFLLGPLFPVLIALMAGGLGQRVQQSAASPVLGLAMPARDADAMIAARERLDTRIGAVLPDFAVARRLRPDEAFDPRAALKRGDYAAIATGSPRALVLTGPAERIEDWQGPVSLVAAEALGQGPRAYPGVVLAVTATSKVDQRGDRLHTAQAAQTLLFLLTMLLAGMVLSNLVEEKANKIIEILAAAIPMDAVFFGKLFAMLAVSVVGICVWGAAAGAILLAGAQTIGPLAPPAVGWPLFLVLGVIYFAMAYLLLGSIFLAIGSMATTVREVQTLSMPATMMQLFVFFFASFAMTQPGSPLELAAIVFPLSSPFAMIARAAQDAAIWPHLAGIGWQALCVVTLVRAGSRLFRRRVMKSGAAGGRKARRGLFGRGGRGPDGIDFAGAVPIVSRPTEEPAMPSLTPADPDRRRVLTWLAASAALPALVAGGSGAAAAAVFPVRFSEAEWRRKLTPAQFHILREHGTEPSGSSPLLGEHRKGTFVCAADGNPLFASSTKFESGTGWPSFYRPLPHAVGTARDTGFGMVRTEVHCARCGGHLGHVFHDGPPPTGLRYCMNGDAMLFRPA